MGKDFRERLLAFIEDIPDSKLEGGFPSRTRCIWSDANFRLDMQTLTTHPPRCWNLQVQVNRGITIRSSKKAGHKGASAAMVLVPIEAPYSADEIREKLTESAIEFGDKSSQY